MASLEDKIRGDLELTGFPTEVVSAGIMQKREWKVLHNPSYLDSDGNKSREFDIRAYRSKSERHRQVDYVVGSI